MYSEDVLYLLITIEIGASSNYMFLLKIGNILEVYTSSLA